MPRSRTCGTVWDHRGMDRVRKLIKLAAFALATVAVVEQLRRPAEERTWEGTVAGLVPYDFRMPTVERARSRWWNPMSRGCSCRRSRRLDDESRGRSPSCAPRHPRGLGSLLRRRPSVSLT